jgi:hypothetical protein
MSFLDKFNKKMTLLESFAPIKNVSEMVERITSSLTPKVGKQFFQTAFDKSENGNGILFIRFAKHPMAEATNQKISECPVSFIISVEGFRDDGTICDECGSLNVEMLHFNDKTNKLRKMRPQRFSNPNMVHDYIGKYFEKYSPHLLGEDGAAAPAGGAAAPAPASGGPVSTSVEGGTTTDNIAVFKPKLGEPMPSMTRRNWEGKKKNKKKSSLNNKK